MIVKELLEGANAWPNTEHALEVHKNRFHKKNVIVTGACGSIGYEIVKFLHDAGARVTAIDHDEYAMSKCFYEYPKVKWVLGDFASVYLEPHQDAFIYHCAAYKHVDMAHWMPYAYDENNAEKLVAFFKKNGLCDRFVFVSSDKAASTTKLGESKRMGENMTLIHKETAIRLVNVVGSRGSVIDLWNKSETPWVCPGHVERYWMSKRDALRAVLDVTFLNYGLYTVQNVPKFNMADIASAYESLYHKKIIRKNSIREGEKDKEELISHEEQLKSVTPELALILPNHV